MFVLTSILSQKQREKYFYSLFEGVFLRDPNYVILTPIIRLEDKYLIFVIEGVIKYSNIFVFGNVVFNKFLGEISLSGILTTEFIILISQQIDFDTIVKTFSPISPSPYIQDSPPKITTVIEPD